MARNFTKYIYNNTDKDDATWEFISNIAEFLSTNDAAFIPDVDELKETNSSRNCTKPFQRGLVMACLNINSLHAHIGKLRITMNSTKIDILCINENNLDSTINDHEVCLLGFELVRRDHNINCRNGGGVCIYIRSNLKNS